MAIKLINPMQIYHEVWLEAHPWRTREWLQERLSDGFAIHHIDGDHSNNKPDRGSLPYGSRKRG